jgi:hypothetical protein
MMLNGIEIPRPKKFEINPTEISVSERTASGRKVKDIVAIKRYFNLSYTGLSAQSMKTFLDVYRAGKAVPFTYDAAEGSETVSVYLESLPHEVFLFRPQYSQNITITLEEE